MLYQKLLTGNRPYYISAGAALPFEAHRHPEIELSCCRRGEYAVRCESREYVLHEGDIVVVNPMAAHELIQLNQSPSKMITIELGPALLGDAFAFFAGQSADCTHYRKEEFADSTPYQTLTALIEEAAALHRTNDAFSELAVKGNLYKISALLLQMMHDSAAPEIPVRKKSDVQKIDKALEIIYNRYFEPLDIEELSAACGYSKSNFCKVFKDITGDTFHATLNRHRIEIACMLLRESGYSIEKIAQETGFADIKSFCRVFKKLKEESAGAYRKRHK